MLPLEQLLLVLKICLQFSKLQQLSPPFDEAMYYKLVQRYIFGRYIFERYIFERYIFGKYMWRLHSWNCQVHRTLPQILT